MGKERKIPDTTSDLDTIVFYDGAQFIHEDIEMFDEHGQLTANFAQRNQERNNRNRERDFARKETEDALRTVVGNEMLKHQLPIDVDLWSKKSKTIFFIDICEVETKKALNRFKLYVDANSNHEESTPDGIDGPTFDLVSRFFIGVGNGLYSNRNYILDQLAEMEDGEKYFQALMKSLIYVERQREPKITYAALP